MYIYKKVEALGCGGWDDSEYYTSDIKYTGEQLTQIFKGPGVEEGDYEYEMMPRWGASAGWLSRGAYEDALSAWRAREDQREAERNRVRAQRVGSLALRLEAAGLELSGGAGIDTLTIIEDSGCCCYEARWEEEGDGEPAEVERVVVGGKAYLVEKGKDAEKVLQEVEKERKAYLVELDDEWQAAGRFIELSEPSVRELNFTQYAAYEQGLVNFRAYQGMSNPGQGFKARVSVVDPKQAESSAAWWKANKLREKGVHELK